MGMQKNTDVNSVFLIILSIKVKMIIKKNLFDYT